MQMRKYERVPIAPGVNIPDTARRGLARRVACCALQYRAPKTRDLVPSALAQSVLGLDSGIVAPQAAFTPLTEGNEPASTGCAYGADSHQGPHPRGLKGRRR